MTTYTMPSTGITYTITTETRVTPSGSEYSVAITTSPRGYCTETPASTAAQATTDALHDLQVIDAVNARSDDEAMGIVRPGITAPLADARYATIYDEV